MSQSGLNDRQLARQALHDETWATAEHCFRHLEDVPGDLADASVDPFEKLVSAPNLVACYLLYRKQGDRAAGVDGLKYSHFSAAEICDVARGYSRALLENTYRPQQVRRKEIQKPNGGSRLLAMPVCMDALIARAVQRFIRHTVDGKLHQNFYAYRPGRGVHDVFVALHKAVRDSGHTVFSSFDIQDAFPSTNLTYLFEQLPEFVTDPRTLTLIERIVRGDESQDLPGLRQGDPLSPSLFNIPLNSLLATWLDGRDEITQWMGYSDDFCFLTLSESDAAQVLSDLEVHLNSHGLLLKPVHNRTWDLRNSSVLEHLGFSLSLENGQPVLHLAPGSWSELELKLQMCHSRKDPSAAATHVARSWITAVGPGLCQLRGSSVRYQLLETLGRAEFRHLNRRLIQKWIDQSVQKWLDKLSESDSELMAVDAPHHLENRAHLRTSAPELTDGDPDAAPFDATNGGDGEQTLGRRAGSPPHSVTSDAAIRRHHLRGRM